LRLNPKTKAFDKINEDRIKKDDYFEKSSSESKKIIYWYDYEEEPERDGVYFYKLRGYNSMGQVMFESDELKVGVTGIRNFKLDQNKPNPFNPTTSISYELFEASHVKLKVFDLIGKEIATLVDENQASGTYTVEFDASKYSNLTSGIYFYKLETGAYTEVKKMILTK
ncbi:MAG: T9SS type A sorting domain-containing protein, partial [Chlorobi bacterium]|nr:T9SS type A sorting domain-containing protein [Chlorobiota bacterium]